MKRAVLITAFLSAAWFGASLLVPLPTKCEACGTVMQPHTRNAEVLECHKCGDMLFSERSAAWGQ